MPIRSLWFVAVAVLLAAGPGRAAEPDGGLLPPRRTEGRGAEGESGGGSGSSGEFEYPAPFEGLSVPFDLGRLQRRFDAARGRETERSDKPRAAEFPFALFLESVRPLGSLKYESQLNYFVGAFTGPAPTLQTLTYEYVFADWNAARIELLAPGGRAESLGFGYQRTFGVGPRGNWAHGALVLPEVSINGSGFVGGSAFYTAIWKPDFESPFSVGGSVGANRASMANRPLGGTEGGMAGGTGSLDRHMNLGRPGGDRGAEEARVWRTLAALNGWYKVSPRITLGIELDAFAHREFGEYVVLPNLTWRPTKHFFAQVGAGYYEIGGRGQAVFACRLNLLNPSPRTAGGGRE